MEAAWCVPDLRRQQRDRGELVTLPGIDYEVGLCGIVNFFGLFVKRCKSLTTRLQHKGFSRSSFRGKNEHVCSKGTQGAGLVSSQVFSHDFDRSHSTCDPTLRQSCISLRSPGPPRCPSSYPCTAPCDVIVPTLRASSASDICLMHVFEGFCRVPHTICLLHIKETI
jgi:hypothetical protein